MLETYSHTRIEAKAQAVMILGRQDEPQQPAAPVISSLDGMLEAEIDRRVAAALEKIVANKEKEKAKN